MKRKARKQPRVGILEINGVIEQPIPPASDSAGGVTTEPYLSSKDHLWQAIERVDQLIRAQTVRWQTTIGANKPEQLWGMVHVTDAEVNTYLNTPFTPLDRLPNRLMREMVPFWQQAKEIDTIIQARVAATPKAVFLRLEWLQRFFGLSSVELDIVLICLLPEMDERYRRLYGYLMDDASRPNPTINLIQQILYPVARPSGEGRTVFDANGALFRHHFLVHEASPQANLSLARQAVHLDDRVIGFLTGDDQADLRLRADFFHQADPNTWDGLIVQPAFLSRIKHLALWWRDYRQTKEAAAILLHGSYGSDQLTAAQAICTATRTTLLVISTGKALQAAEGWDLMVDLVYREARFQQAAIYWTDVEMLLEPEQNQRWHYLLNSAEQAPGLTFFASQTAWDPAGNFQNRPFLRLEFAIPDYGLRRQLWEKILPRESHFAAPRPDRVSLIEALANSFQFTVGQMRDALATARGQATLRQPQDPLLTSEDLYVGCRRQSGRKLITMAQRIESRTDLTFDNLILPKSNSRQLDELRQRIQYRSRVYTGLGFEKRLALGKGLIALFTGSSGTGKTMAAELLAKEQQVDLYKVDLAAVVSKYVGETEKNLSQVFNEAEDANAIIFFDEADALFGKRGEVKEARDRWANIEVNYLLQRVEEYAGVVVMASNLRQNIDDAFLRRIHAIVDFPFPTAEARYHILHGLFPTGLERPTDEEIRQIADRFNMAGGNLKNIVLDAAFRVLAETAERETPVMTLRHLALSTAREYQKLGRPITKGEFSHQFYQWVEAEIL